MLNLTLTPAALSLCNAYAAGHLAGQPTQLEIELTISASLDGLLKLFVEERWLMCADVHQFKAISIMEDPSIEPLMLHAKSNDDESWIIGTPDEFPVTPEYLRRRAESETAIIRQLSA